MKRSVTRVLVVDDYAPWHQHVRSMLRENVEFQVVAEASNGPEAVEKAQELRLDLILLDVSLPQLDGIEAARQIRAFSPAARIPFISENRLVEIAAAALQAGGSVLS